MIICAIRHAYYQSDHSISCPHDAALDLGKRPLTLEILIVCKSWSVYSAAEIPENRFYSDVARVDENSYVSFAVILKKIYQFSLIWITPWENISQDKTHSEIAVRMRHQLICMYSLGKEGWSLLDWVDGWPVQSSSGAPAPRPILSWRGPLILKMGYYENLKRNCESLLPRFQIYY